MDMEKIRIALQKRAEIKEQMRVLQETDRKIVEWLDSELIIAKNETKSQKFELDGFTVVAKVPQSVKVDQAKAEELMTKYPVLHDIGLFKFKWDISMPVFEKMSEAEQNRIAECLTVTPGKTQYEMRETQA